MTDYLWDKSGDADPDVERLERALSVFAQASPPPPLQLPGARLSATSRWIGIVLLAASVAIAAGGVIFAFRFRPAAPAWQVTSADGQSSLSVGGWLETGEGQRAAFNVADIGHVVVEPHTRLRLLDTRPGEHRLELLHGTLHATIWAPPNQFFVETPSTLAVDLGCAYTLSVDDEGAGLVSVLVGWVGLQVARSRVVHSGGLGVRDAAAHRPGNAVQRARLAGIPRSARDHRLQQRIAGDVEGADAAFSTNRRSATRSRCGICSHGFRAANAIACSIGSRPSSRRRPASLARESARATR